MKRTLLALAGLIALPTFTQSGSATAHAYCRSFVFNPTTTLNRTGNATYQLYFTTYDPAHNLPLFVPATGSNGQIIVSSEVQQKPGSSVYSTTYSMWQNGFVAQDGLLNMYVPATDANHNRIRDAIEPDLAFYAGVNGKCRNIWPGTNEWKFESRLSRPAGNYSGAYSGYMTGTGASYVFTGTLGIMHMRGSVEYYRGSTNYMGLYLERVGKLGVLSALTGSTTYKATTNYVIIGRTTLVDEENNTYVMLPATLYRVKDRYVGSATFVDGEPETPWPDFKDWALELQDTTDNNENGIPDLSDPAAAPDDRAPVVTITIPAGTTRVSSFPITLRGTARDRSEVLRVDYRVQNGDENVLTGSATGTTKWSIPVEALPPGTNVFWVSAVDAYGNTSAEVRRTILYRGQ